MLIFKKLKALIYRVDFRSNPIIAIIKRVKWKIRWMFTNKHWLIPTKNGNKLYVCNSGAGALIYYQGFTESDTFEYISNFLKKGNLFLDVGAHLGEYTIIASKLVGVDGEVHAFEPLDDIAKLLRANIIKNNLANVIINNNAVSDIDGVELFEIYKEPSVSSLIKSQHKRNETIKLKEVECISLNSYWMNTLKRKKIDLIKIDVEGAEFKVISGAGSILSQDKDISPVVLFEYSTSNYKQFGYKLEDVYEKLNSYGYQLYVPLKNNDLKPVDINRPTNKDCNMIAIKI